MLFENRKQVNSEYLMKKYSTVEDHQKLLKKPSFEAHKSRKKIDTVNNGRIKVNKGAMMRSSFLATDKTTGLKVELRYAKSNNEVIVGDRIVDQFEPRYIKVDGANFSFQNDIDLATYLFLHPNNELSPLRDKLNKAKPKVVFVDSKKRAKEKTDRIGAVGKAMEHSKNLKEEDLIILAKGLGLKGIDKKDPEEVRADLMEFALNKSEIYNEKVNTQLTYVEGRIWNLIDKGVVKLTNVGSVRRWSWVKGDRAGETILDIANVTQDARQVLKNHFFSDITTYMNILNNLNNDISATEKATRDLEAMEAANSVPVTTPSYQIEREIGEALPAYLKEPSQEFVDSANAPKYTEAQAIAELTDEFGNPPHHNKVKAWLRKMNGE